MEKHLSFFKFSRFFLLLRKDSMENYRRYIFQFLFLILFLLVSNWFRLRSIYENVDHNLNSWGFLPTDFQHATTRAVLGSIPLVLTGVAIMASLDFSAGFNTKGRRIQFLMYPITSFEKFVSGLCVFLSKFFVILPLALLGEELIRVVLLSLAFPTNYIFFPEFSHLFPLLGANPSEYFLTDSLKAFFIAVASGIMISSFLILGEIIWPKKGVFYATLSVFGVLIITFFVSYAFARVCFGDIDQFLYAVRLEDNPFINQFIPYKEWIVVHFRTLLSSFLYLVSLVNFMLAYYRFKEMDVNNRFK